MVVERVRVTTEDLLEAGWQIVQQELQGNKSASENDAPERVPRLLSSIRPQDVATRAGVTTGAFYRRWSNKSKFIDALAVYVLSKDRHEQEYLDRAFHVFDDALESGASLEDIIRRTAETDLEVTSSSAAFATQIHFWSLCRRHPEVARLLRSQYLAIEADWMARYEKFITRRKLRLRPGVDIAEIGAVFSALAEGMAIRRVVDKDGATSRAFANALMALVLSFIDWHETGVSIEDALREATKADGLTGSP